MKEVLDDKDNEFKDIQNRLKKRYDEQMDKVQYLQDEIFRKDKTLQEKLMLIDDLQQIS